MATGRSDNPLHFRGERGKVGDIAVCCILHDSIEAGTWYATEEGGACLVDHDGVADPLIESHRIQHVIHLRDVDDVEKHVRNAVRSDFDKNDGRLLLFSNPLRALTAVSLYQGYFAQNDSSERRGTIIATFVQTLGDVGWPTPWNAFTCLVYQQLLDDGMTPLNWYFLQNLPPVALGPIVAHGLRFKNLWEYRYMEAMVAGWRYQLDCPEDQFGTLLPDTGTSFFGPIIDSVAPDIAQDLLKFTGIDVLDAKRARELAEVIAGDDARMYSSALLTLLSTASRSKKEKAISTSVSLPNGLAP
jgi:hypothetical protein